MKDKKTPDSATTAKSGLNQNKDTAEPVRQETTHNWDGSQTVAKAEPPQCEGAASDAQANKTVIRAGWRPGLRVSDVLRKTRRHSVAGGPRA